MTPSRDRSLGLLHVTPSPAEVRALASAIDRQLSTPAGAAPPGFIVVTPVGLRERARLDELLDEAKIRRSASVPIPAWPRRATFLYVRSFDEAALRRAVAYERAWETFFPGIAAECWLLPSSAAFEAALAIKQQLRTRIVSRTVQVTLPDSSFVASLHSLHMPDGHEVARDWGRLTGP